MSSRAASGTRLSRIHAIARTPASAATGTLTKNVHRHPSVSTKVPPRIGPTARPVLTAAVHRP